MITTKDVIGVVGFEPQISHFSTFKCASLTTKLLDNNKKINLNIFKKNNCLSIQHHFSINIMIDS
jgi:hypothetical protein